MSSLRKLTGQGITVSVCALALASAARATTTTYTITELRPIDVPGSTTAHGLNGLGMTAGVVTDSNGIDTAALFTPSGSPTVLPNPDGAAGGYGQALNSAGVVVGGAVFGRRPQAVLWTSGVPNPIPLSDNDSDPDDELFASYGRGINDNGVIVGDAETIFGQNAFRYVNGDIQLLFGQEEGVNTRAAQVNAMGHIVGTTGSSNGDRAIVWAGNTSRLLEPPGTQGGSSVGDGMNDLGAVVGYSSTAAFGDHATAWDADGNPMDLGLIEGHTASEAFGVNNQGVIVGLSLDATFNGHAVVWDSATSSPTDLNTLIDVGNSGLPGGVTWDLFIAYGINDAGQIVGLGDFNGEIRGFLATPVPEPGFIGLAASSLGALTTRRRRGQR